VFRVLVGKFEEKIRMGRWYRWNNNIKSILDTWALAALAESIWVRTEKVAGFLTR
jgi:hypothetical protein